MANFYNSLTFAKLPDGREVVVNFEGVLPDFPELKRWKDAISVLESMGENGIKTGNAIAAIARVGPDWWWNKNFNEPSDAKVLAALNGMKYRRAALQPPHTAKVYLLKHENDGVVKIGYTKNLPLRIKSLAYVRGPLAEIFSVECDDAPLVEYMCHVRCASLRLSGEWFALQESGIEVIVDFLTKNSCACRSDVMEAAK